MRSSVRALASFVCRDDIVGELKENREELCWASGEEEEEESMVEDWEDCGSMPVIGKERARTMEQRGKQQKKEFLSWLGRRVDLLKSSTMFGKRTMVANPCPSSRSRSRRSW